MTMACNVLWLRYGCLCAAPASMDAALAARSGSSDITAAVAAETHAVFVHVRDGSIVGLPLPPTSLMPLETGRVKSAVVQACVSAYAVANADVALTQLSAANLAEVPSLLAQYVKELQASTGATVSLVTGAALDVVTQRVDASVNEQLRTQGAGMRYVHMRLLPPGQPRSVITSSFSAVARDMEVAANERWPVSPGADVCESVCESMCESVCERTAARVCDDVRIWQSAPDDAPELSSSITAAACASAPRCSSSVMAALVRDFRVCVHTHTHTHTHAQAAASVTGDASTLDVHTVSETASQTRTAAGTPHAHSSVYLAMLRAHPCVRVCVCAGAVHPAMVWRCATALAQLGRTRQKLPTDGSPVPAETWAALSEWAAALQSWLLTREYAHELLRAEPSLRHVPGARPLHGMVSWCTEDHSTATYKAHASVKHSSPAEPAKRSAAASTSGWLTSGLSALGSIGTSALQSVAAVSMSAPAAHPANKVAPLNPETLPLSELVAAWTDDALQLVPKLQRAGAHFTAALTGYPLVDAAILCMQHLGYCPPPLVCLLQMFWCKYLLRSWTEGVRVLLSWDVTTDYPLAVLQWQWNVGLAADCAWVTPVDGPSALWAQMTTTRSVGALETPSSSASVGSTEYASHGGASWMYWLRWRPELHVHAHAMAHPAAHEFGFGPDKFAAFVRTWLGVDRPASSGVSLGVPATIPDAFAYSVFAMSDAAAAACGLRFAAVDDLLLRRKGVTHLPLALPVTSREAAHEHVVEYAAMLYCRPLVSVAEARRHALDSVLHVCRSQSSAHTVVEPLRAAQPTHPGDEMVSAFRRGQSAAGYDRRWGCVQAWPVLVEEDAALLLEQRSTRAEDGWEAIVDDESRRLRVFMQSREDSAVKTVLATATLPRHTSHEVFEAITILKKYRSWDLTWQHVTTVSEPLDAFNEAFYYIADSPPAPYSYVITQRDFMMFRHVVRDPHTGIDAVAHRNGSHAGMAMSSKFIRGEALGVVGFTVQPVHAPAGLREASLPDGRNILSPAAHIVAPDTAADTSLRKDWSTRNVPQGSAGAHVVLITAADPKGSLPAALVNFVAKRTPRIWVDRLTQACDRFATEV